MDHCRLHIVDCFHIVDCSLDIATVYKLGGRSKGSSNNLRCGSQSSWILGHVYFELSATFNNLHAALHNLEAKTGRVSVPRKK